ncbi:gamma-glutamyl-gamma-aminobutyrate hydrolase family protein [Pseudogracilibacillus sp. ICA-222130]|uniref:gamma-glutamyl-gamma-aminobutyrate hydrolase family protein n=1 Tax=Pseudogracilibacillus sp. ICA-222130 TaxID=3134655 RepID=UPI0030BF16DE
MHILIGITPNMKGDQYNVTQIHSDIIEDLHAIPFILPYVEKEKTIDSIVMKLDGLYVTGGDDIDPTFFNEEPMEGLRFILRKRDMFEQKLIQKMLQQNKPIFAICRGAQILNIATGGDMYQHIYGQMDKQLLQHEQHANRSHQSHFITIKEGTILYEVMQKKRMKVNSFHHQANRQVKQPMIVSATASDGIKEAIESTAHTFVVGVQWHPEYLYDTDIGTRTLYKTFIKKCEERKRLNENRGHTL